MTVSFIGGRSWSTLTKTVTLFLTTGKRHSIIDHVQLGLNYASSFHENNIYLFVFPCGPIPELCPRVAIILDLLLTF